MREDDPLAYWKLSDFLSVVDAAILIVGGDPSEVDELYETSEVGLHKTEVKRTDGHPGFGAVFTGLKTAVKLGRLKALLEYRVYRSDSYEPSWVVPKNFLTDPSRFEVDFKRDDMDRLFIAKEPDWMQTMVDVRDLKAWLHEKGVKSGFFFSDPQGDEDFMDPSHEHFAPELAMAVAAWRGLSQTRKFPQGPKVAIEEWINKNPSKWHGDSEMSASAKERIATLANWRRSGGANPTGG